MTGGTVFDGFDPTVYEGPSQQLKPTGHLHAGERLAIACTILGRDAGDDAPFGKTPIWDYTHLENGYVSDAYINSGQDQAVGPQCGGAQNHYDFASMNLNVDQPGLRKLYDEIRFHPGWAPRGPDAHFISIYDDRPLLHREGRALDYRMNANDPNELLMGNEIRDYLHRNAKAYGIQEIIWNAESWDMQPENVDRGFQPYDPGCGGDVTCLHKDHLHIGMNWAGAVLKTRRWEVIIDNWGRNNPDDETGTRVRHSENWTASRYVPNFWGTGYRVATAQVGIEDGMTFSFYLSAEEPKRRTVSAWWTAGPTRTRRAPFVVRNGQGQHLATVHSDQRENGGQWNTLGAWEFSEGWNSIALSRSIDPVHGEHIIGDAVRVRGGEELGDALISVAAVRLEGVFFKGGWGGGQDVLKETVVDGVFLPSGRQWDQGAVWWDERDGHQRAIVVEFARTYTVRSLVLQADHNDKYDVWYLDPTTGTWLLAWTAGKVRGSGMRTRPDPADNRKRHTLPLPVVTRALKITAREGDSLHSVSEIQSYGR